MPIFGRKDWDLTNKLELIPEEEPCFLIRGQDFFSETIITNYLNMLRAIKTKHYEPKRELIMNLVMHRELMKQWVVKKFPDVKEI